MPQVVGTPRLRPILSRMKNDTTVIYNGACPICSREIAHYRARVEKHGAPLRFADLNEADLEHYGLTSDDAARRLYVTENGQLLSGTDAFLALWRHTPGYGWLARIVGLPGIRQIAGFVYDRALAPMLYAAHRRRQARLAGPEAKG